MSLVILTRGKVIEKKFKDYEKQDGTKIRYYNIKIGNPDKCESQTITVDKDIYEAVKEGEEIKLEGLCGGINKDMWYSFKKLLK